MKIDTGFYPIVQFNKQFEEKVKKENQHAIIRFSLSRENGLYETFERKILCKGVDDDLNFKYCERLIKSALWIVGGYKLSICCDSTLFLKLFDAYRHGGLRDFDVRFFEDIYGVPFKVEYSDEIKDSVRPKVKNKIRATGNRLGLDCGGSDIKIASLNGQNVVFSREIVWNPKINDDPNYHIKFINDALEEGASKLKSVDSIGVSSAGIHIDNETRVASLFIKIPKDKYDKVKCVFKDVAKKFNAPLKVANDGDVTALAGAIELDKNSLLGIAMGTSLASGYVDKNQNLLGFISELAFVPLDVNENAMIDEWSGDYGCGVKYLSQDGVIKLCEMANINLLKGNTPAEKLKIAQTLVSDGDILATDVFCDVGSYLAYAIMYYSTFYDIKNVLLMGRVMSGKGGEIIYNQAKAILQKENYKITLFLPDEKSRRLGQAVAASYL